MRLFTSSLLSLFLLAPALACADVVDPEPDSCPVGSTPSTAHSGPFCRPSGDCTSDSACSGGATCMEVRQCIETRGCGGRTEPDAAPCTLQHVVGPCGGDGSCAVGACTTRRVCSSGSTASANCSCRAAPTASGPVPAVLGLIVAGLLLARRR